MRLLLLLCSVLLAAVLPNPAMSAEGDPDLTFGSNGIVTFNRGSSDAAYAVAHQADGRKIIAGTVTNSRNSNLIVIRLNGDGSFDSSFGTNGIVTYNGSADGPDAATGVAVQPDGRIVVVGRTANATDTDILVLRLNANGTLDTSFNVIGVRTFDFGGDDTAGAVAIQSGRIVIAGTASNGLNNDIVVLRLLADGTSDTTFNGTGLVVFDRGANDSGRALLAQSNGRVVVAGQSSNGANADGILIRFDANGTLDPTFGGTGVVVFDRGGPDAFNAVAQESAGRIVAAGSSSSGSDSDIVLVSLNADGTADTTFGSAGVVLYAGPSGGDDAANGVAVQSNGRIVAAGQRSSGTDLDLVVMRLNSDGTLDSTFSGDGIIVYQGATGGDDRANAVLIQPDGKVLAAGERASGTGSSIVALRFMPNGDADTTFDLDGIFSYSSGIDTLDIGSAVAVQSNGRIVVAGQTSGGSGSDLLVLRFRPKGQRDTSFDRDGVFIFDGPAGGDDAARAVAIQPDGKIVVAGQTSNGSDADMLVMRLLDDGSLDPSFSSDGIATFGGSANGDDSANAVAIQPDGKIVVAGQSSNGTDDDILLVRYTASGSLDASFGTNGVVTYDGGFSDTGKAVAVQTNGKIVVAGTSSNGADTDLVLLRFTSAGSLDGAFGSGGVVKFDSGSFDAGRALALYPDGRIAVSGSVFNGIKNVLLAARFNGDGTPDLTFSGDGIARYNSGMPGDDSANGVAVQANGKVVATGITDGGDAVVVRFNEDGTLDSGFNGDGAFVYASSGGGNDSGRAIAIQSDGRIVVAGTSDRDVLVMRLKGQKVEVVSPNGGEVFPSNSSQSITWSAPPKAVFFTVELSQDDGVSWSVVASNLTGTAYSWTVPVPGGNKRKCRIRVTGYDANKVKVSSDKSDGPFTIEVVRLDTPNGGEVFSAGDPVTITWTTGTTKRTVDHVFLYYTLNGGRKWLPVAGPIADSGSFGWTAPVVSSLKKKGRIKVVLKDLNNKTLGSDASDAFMTFQ